MTGTPLNLRLEKRVDNIDINNKNKTYADLVWQGFREGNHLPDLHDFGFNIVNASWVYYYAVW